jgi:hypothetical protein
LDTITELFDFGGSGDNPVQDQEGERHTFVFGFLIRTGAVYVDRHSEKRIVKSTEVLEMFFSIPGSNINDFLNLIHSKHSFLKFTTDYTD